MSDTGRELLIARVCCMCVVCVFVCLDCSDGCCAPHAMWRAGVIQPDCGGVGDGEYCLVATE